MSVDRVNNDKSHTADNCQLVCLAINYGKNDNTNDGAIEYIKKIRELK